MAIMEAIERVRNLENELRLAKRDAGRVLRATRKKLRLTIREASEAVENVSPATVYNTEKNKAWNTKTAEKIGRTYQKLTAA